MKNFFGAFALFVVFAFTPPAQAASQDECAIWICLPAGFPSGCGSAAAAMRERIKKLKAPLPNFLSCSVNPSPGSGSHMESQYGLAAFIPSYRVCTKYQYHGVDQECVAWETVPNQYIKGLPCQKNRDGYTTPRGCTETYRFAEVFVEGQLAGPTYYWN